MIVTPNYSIEAEVNAEIAYTPRKETLQKAIEGSITPSVTRSHREAYICIQAMLAAGYTMKSIVDKFSNYCGDYYWLDQPDGGYIFLTWLIAPDIVPIEYLLVLTYAASPYKWAIDALKLCDDVRDIIILVDIVRNMRSNPHESIKGNADFAARNKAARSAFLAKYSTTNAHSDKVLEMSAIRSEYRGKCVYAPKFFAKNVGFSGRRDAFVPIDEFRAAFARATWGVFEEFHHWDKCCVAGGIVSRLLIGDHVVGSSDVDIFVTGKTDDDRADNFVVIVRTIDEILRKRGKEVYYTPTGSVLSIYAAESDINIQVISGSNVAAADVIARFDMSNVCAAYDGTTVHVTYEFLKTMQTGVATVINANRLIPRRIVKTLWRGWGVAVDDALEEKIMINELVGELESKDDAGLIAELQVGVILTGNDAWNRVVIGKFGGDNICVSWRGAVELIEFNSDFSSYIGKVYKYTKFFQLMNQRVINAHANEKFIISMGNKPLGLYAEELTVVKAGTKIQMAEWRRNRGLVVTCKPTEDFRQFCAELDGRVWRWWRQNVELKRPVTVGGGDICIYIRKNGRNKAIFRNETGQEVDVKHLLVGDVISKLAFTIEVSYERAIRGIMLICTSGFVRRGLHEKLDAMERKETEVVPEEELPIEYDSE